jgi:hypothetical protein
VDDGGEVVHYTDRGHDQREGLGQKRDLAIADVQPLKVREVAELGRDQ